MSARWSQVYGSWIFDCIYGCFAADFESQHEAEQAFLAHDCRVSEPCS